MDNTPAPISPISPRPAVQPEVFSPVEPSNRRWLLWLAGGLFMLIIGIALGIFSAKFLNQSITQSQISSYEDCLATKGSIVQYSYPATCVTASGQRFVQPLTDEEKQSLQPPDLYREPAGSAATANWKTYTNTKYGFSIRHPEELSESVTNIDSGSFGEKVFFNLSTVDPQNCRGDCPIIEKTEKVSVANLETTKIEGWQGEIGGCGPQKYLTYVFKRDQYFISFTLFAATCGELKNNSGGIAQLKEIDINLFDQILSTFKFTD